MLVKFTAPREPFVRANGLLSNSLLNFGRPDTETDFLLLLVVAGVGRFVFAVCFWNLR